MIVRSQKDLTADLRSHLAPAQPSFAPQRVISKRIALFAVHGISPIQRYAFQDQVASALQSFLNAQEQAAGSKLSWNPIVHWPKIAQSNAPENVAPAALRIYRSDDNPENPTGHIYDVYEGYWSPLSKGKTSISSALRWLLNATFLGNSSTANIPSTPQKLWSDVSYLAIYLVFAVAACALALGLGLAAWQLLAKWLPASNVSLWTLLQDPIHTVLRLPVAVYVEFAIDIAIGYVVAQMVVAYLASRGRNIRTAALSADAHSVGSFKSNTISASAFHKAALRILWAALAVLVGIAVGIAYLPGAPHPGPPIFFVLYIAVVALAVGLLQLARAIADFAVESVLGDVQIYTTHDANSTFFSIRQQIIATVAASLRGVLTAVHDPDGDGYYDAIHILGHSLGSTIGMDVLIRLRQMIEQDALAQQQWNKIRSFTTFGTALEKTRFFFDVRQPTINAAQDQWGNDVYGRFFTADSHVLNQPTNAAGIYWSNYWYFRDIVANEIVSYQSDVNVGTFAWTRNTRPICNNVLLPHERPRLAWVHSDYLADTLFWATAGPVLVS